MARAVDVRDMTCAQALALVARALTRLDPGADLEVRYNADDVRHDLLVWSADRGHAATVSGPDLLQLRKGSLPWPAP